MSGHLRFTSLGTLLSALKISLNHGQLTGDLIVFAVSILSHHAGLLQLALQTVHALLIGDASVLKHLAHAEKGKKVVKNCGMDIGHSKMK